MMKLMPTLATIMILSSCGQDSSTALKATPSALPLPTYTISTEKLYFHGPASVFSSDNTWEFGRNTVVENSFINLNGEVFAYFDENAISNLTRAHIGPNAALYDHKQVITPGDRRFSYVFTHNNVIYDFYYKANKIYLEKSLDGVTWSQMNGGQPVLNDSSDPQSLYYKVWNVGVDVDDNGVFHMLIESSDDRGNAYAGLTYSTAVLSGDMISFDANKSATHLVNDAGNPYLKNIPGKGMLVFYGKLKNNSLWYISTGKLVAGVLTESPGFQIGATGVHVCDPAAIELPDGRTILSVSFDQVATYFAFSNMTLEQIYDSL